MGALPAALYALQNTMAQIGYQNLDSLTFNLLNQTKARRGLLLLWGRKGGGCGCGWGGIDVWVGLGWVDVHTHTLPPQHSQLTHFLSASNPPKPPHITHQTLAAAVCLYLVMGRRQTPLQLVALALLLSACMCCGVGVVFCHASCDVVFVRASNQVSRPPSLLVLGPTRPPHNPHFNPPPHMHLQPPAIILNWPSKSKAKTAGAEANNPLEATTFYLGVLPVLLASATSGICAALTQKTLQVGGWVLRRKKCG